MGAGACLKIPASLPVIIFLDVPGYSYYTLAMRRVEKHTAWLIAYSMKPGLSARERSLLQQRLHTHVNYSNYGKYRYQRKGLLDEIPRVSLIRGVFIVREEDYGKVREALEGYAVIHARRVIVTAEDRRQLGLGSEKAKGG
jgi:hypothetical protein